MQTAEFFDLVEDFFGPRAVEKAFEVSEARVTVTLYETFRVTFGLDGDHGQFGAGIEIGSGSYLGTFFGRSLSLNSDQDSILQSLKVIDEWCRLHLPDKFLERYDAGLAGR